MATEIGPPIATRVCTLRQQAAAYTDVVDSFFAPKTPPNRSATPCLRVHVCASVHSRIEKIDLGVTRLREAAVFRK